MNDPGKLFSIEGYIQDVEEYKRRHEQMETRKLEGRRRFLIPKDMREFYGFSKGGQVLATLLAEGILIQSYDLAEVMAKGLTVIDERALDASVRKNPGVTGPELYQRLAAFTVILDVGKVGHVNLPKVFVDACAFGENQRVRLEQLADGLLLSAHDVEPLEDTLFSATGYQLNDREYEQLQGTHNLHRIDRNRYFSIPAPYRDFYGINRGDNLLVSLTLEGILIHKNVLTLHREKAHIIVKDHDMESTLDRPRSALEVFGELCRMSVIKQVDKRGRVIIPKVLLDACTFQVSQPVQIKAYLVGFLLTRYDSQCVFCGSVDKLHMFKGNMLCSGCLRQLKAIMDLSPKEESQTKE